MFGSLDKDLGGILGSYTLQKLRDCWDVLVMNVNILIEDKVNLLTINDSLILYNSPHVNMIDLTLNESRPLDESAVSEKSGDFSHSNTVILSQEPLHIQPRTSPMYILPQEKLMSSLLTRVAIGW